MYSVNIRSINSIFNLLHSLKIALMTCELVNAQTYLKTFLSSLAVKLHNTELHICNCKKCTYKILKHVRAIYVNTKFTGQKRIFKLFSLYAVRLSGTFKRVHTVRGVYILRDRVYIDSHEIRDKQSQAVKRKVKLSIL